MSENNIIKKAADKAESILKQDRFKKLDFHNYYHTLEVVFAVIEIGANSELNTEEIEQVVISAWFHDTGYGNKYMGHEKESIKIAREFLISVRYEPSKVEKIIKCIEATHMPQNPKSTLEMIVCDADLYHLSSNDYMFRNNSLRSEWKKVLNREYSDEEWYKENLLFFKRHHYFTLYGQQVLEKRKHANLESIERKLAKSLSNL